MGKPLDESRTEVAYAADFVRWYAEEAVRLNETAHRQPGRRITHRHRTATGRPVPADHPVELPACHGHPQIAPALAAGCTVVLKPAALTPLTSLLLARSCWTPAYRKGW